MAEWFGTPFLLKADYLQVLQLTDYAQIGYSHRDDRGMVDFYAAYYDSQSYAAVAHSPQELIP